jgi:hypothetical protein
MIAEPRFGSPIGPWHKWWAWRPVHSYDRRLIWLRPCWRRCIQKHNYLDGGGEFWFQYAVELPQPAA